MSGQTIGLFRNDFDVKLAKKAFNYPKIITLRDPIESPKALQSIGIKNYDLSFDDALFCDKYEDRKVIRKLIESSGLKSEKFISFHMHYWGVKTEEDKKLLLDKLSYSIKSIKESFKDIPILLIPMVQSDYLQQKEFLDFIKNDDVYLLKYDYDFKKIRSVISESLLCVTMKHHPIIFSVGEKIPVISLSYSKYYEHKNYGALKIFGLEKYNVPIEKEDFLDLFKQNISHIKSNYAENAKYLEDLFLNLQNKKLDFIKRVKKLLL